MDSLFCFWIVLLPCMCISPSTRQFYDLSLNVYHKTFSVNGFSLLFLEGSPYFYVYLTYHLFLCSCRCFMLFLIKLWNHHLVDGATVDKCLTVVDSYKPPTESWNGPSAAMIIEFGNFLLFPNALDSLITFRVKFHCMCQKWSFKELDTLPNVELQVHGKRPKSRTSFGWFSGSGLDWS